MLMKIVKEAGFELISNEDRACLLKCVEDLQAERDGYREMIRSWRQRDAAAEEHF